jgi:hypothetical protein
MNIWKFSVKRQSKKEVAKQIKEAKCKEREEK